MQDKTPGRDFRTYAILGAALTVYRILGSGFLESIYREALAVEFDLRRIPFASEVACSVQYKGHLLRGQRIDFVCYAGVIVEIKARSAIGPAEAAQVLNYLATTGHQVALLVNFGGPRLDYRRFVLTKPKMPGNN
jgi:GxxExxY protein